MTATADNPALIPGTTTGTGIAYSTADAIKIRGRDLVRELMGEVDFTTAMLFQFHGKLPSPAERAVVDACMVALMEHGLTPSSISARLIYTSSPDLQGAVASGLLGAGGAFLGVMEDLARLLQAGVVAIAAEETTAEEFCRTLITERLDAKQSVPGFGHHIHRPDDPRTARLLEIAEQQGTTGEHVELLRTLSATMDDVKGKHVTVNVTGAVAAVLSDLGYSWRIMRGFSLVARSAGLVGHLLEEQQNPLGMELWGLVERAVPYTGERG